MTYVAPDWTAVNSTVDAIGFANTSTGGYFWFGMNVMVGLIIFISLAGTFGFEAGLMTGAFVAMMMGFMLVYMDLMSINLLGIFIGILVVMIMYIMWNRQE